ncbi:MAG: DNA replication/repair protein RecF [Anaerolineae bacterium]
MRLSYLSLTHFRNYVQEEVRPAEGANLLLGDNAQGKSNLLEAIVCLSTTRSYRTSVDRNLINHAFLDEPIPYARVTAHLESGPVRLVELVITLEREMEMLRSRKHLRLDGVPHRLLDALGSLPTVLFTPDDVSLVSGPPADRRRYLDVLLCQASLHYCRSLSLYNRSILQRNHLLRLIRHRRSDPEQLHYWDQLLAEHGAVITSTRRRALEFIAEAAAAIHAGLAVGEGLGISYRPGIEPELACAEVGALAQGMLSLYLASHRADIERGVTAWGPHRDDISITLGQEEAGVFGSRGQMRTIALSLRLVEAEYLARELGRRPVLLFDDVMSELDSKRRRALESAMLDSSQSFVTDLDETPFSPRFIAKARLFRVAAGTIRAITPPESGGD